VQLTAYVFMEVPTVRGFVFGFGQSRNREAPGSKDMNFAKPLLCAVALASLSLPACGGTPGEDEGQTASVQQAAIPHGGSGPPVCKALVSNGLTENGLTDSALTANGGAVDALTAGPLTGESLMNNPITSGTLDDPLTIQVLQYVVSCALGPKQSVDLTVGSQNISLQGELGLARHWGFPNGSCGKSCQEWVSACVLARLDYLGQHIDISVRGDNPHLEACPKEIKEFSEREATYYGNVFASPQQRYACLSPQQTDITRVCGSTDNGCVVNVVGSCPNFCEKPTKDGAFQDCRAGDGDKDDREWHGSVTVYLKP
jgi:hypothetical protein